MPRPPSSRRWLLNSFAEELQQRLPMPLGGNVIVHGCVGWHPPVPRVVGLDAMIHSRIGERALESLLLRIVEAGILDGSAHVHARLDARGEQVRTVWQVG